MSEAFDFDDEKYLVKLDWYASESQRLSATYMYNDSFNYTPSDGDLDEFEFDKHFYKRGAELTSYNINWYADWSENFSSEVRYSYSEVAFLQASVSGGDFAEFRIELDEVDVYDLDWEVQQFVARGTYTMDDHSITFGYERDSSDIFNLFYQHVDTEIRFDGIDNFEQGIAARVYYGNAVTNNELDAAVSWGYTIHTAYIEDEWQVRPDFRLTYGLRYDSYESDDKPALNPAFVADYGFPNTATLDGLDLLMPRIGFTYEMNDNKTLSGGVGLFSGGNPNVWYSNVFSNTNTTAVQTQIRGVNLFEQTYELCEPSAPVCGPGYGIPSQQVAQVAAGDGSNFEIVYLDPNFEAPSEWKYALGLTWQTDSGYLITADAQITRGKDTAIYKHGDLEQVGTNDFGNGYPEYDSVRLPSFVLTNSGVGNESESVAVSVFKDFENGLDVRLGYAWVDSKDGNPMKSSVAFSNYLNRTFYDPEEEVLSPSNYNIEHRFTGVLNYNVNLFGDYNTRFSLFAQSSSGVPYSVTLGGFEGTGLAYGFTPYLDFLEHVLVEPGTRNNREGSSWTKADLRISQELPGINAEHSARAFIVVDNVTNLLNDEWGVMYKPNFPYGVTQGDIDAGRTESRIGGASLWEIRIGAEYRF